MNSGAGEVYNRPSFILWAYAMLTRIPLGFLVVCLALAIIAAGLLGGLGGRHHPKLPSLEVLTDYRPKIPCASTPPTACRLADGEERRGFTRIQDVPQLMKQAIAFSPGTNVLPAWRH